MRLSLFFRGSSLTENCADGGLGRPKHRIPNLLVVFLNGLRWSTRSSISSVSTNAVSWPIRPVLPMRWPLRTDIRTECAVTFACWPLGLEKEVGCPLALRSLMTNGNDNRSWLQVAEVRP